MNLTLLPTDLKLTNKGPEKSLPTLNEPANGNPSSQFGQLLNAETASMRKHTAQADKNSLKEGKSAADKTAQGEWSPLQPASDNAVVTDKLQAEVALQENRAEFAVLKDEDLLSAEALSAVIPIQIAGLVTPSANSAAFQESTDGLMENSLLDDENSVVQTLLGNDIKDTKVAGTDLSEQSLSEQSKETAPDRAIQFSAAQDIALSNKTENSADARPVLTPIADQVKLAATNKAGYDNTLSKNISSDHISSNNIFSNNISSKNSGKELNLLQMAIQGAPALTAATIETASIDSPAVLAASPLLSGGQQATGQFQLNSTTAPLLSAHLGSEEWQQQLNQHVLFFNRNGLRQAELRLHPQELGALHVRMSVEDNQAQLHFVSAHQNVRAALEAALPGLRHSLAESGIQLAQSSVSSDAQGNWQQEHHASNQANNQNSDHSNSHANTQRHGLVASTGVTAAHDSAIRLTPQQLASTRGGVDTFA
ncbi:flagellar hook-length control protein FliK [Xenorhabdus miraniensis]|uniref:Flagellar hook-length control protein FliK n=1 Tax=Xenorhabdus miraniensis TaxID=351674 RepID=A0A2D0JPP2_9GAMM|nr:flagellar hook-length control protein FliK [Xenorhabdus miraniensis]PHM48281.1 flagellar hook-length control protein FliK [Xenorhabdus miraniensis]